MTYRMTSKALAVAAVTALVAACGGGSGGGGSGQSPAPTIGAILNQQVNQDTTVGPLPVAVGEGSSSGDQLQLTAASSNAALIPPGQITVMGSGTARTLSITPAAEATGTAQITLTVRDDAGRMATRSFQLAVNPVYASFTQRADAIFGQAEDATPDPVNGFTFQPDADGTPNAFSAFLQ